ncbi:hypothetical protein L9W80_18430 [Vibrio aestuarianus]|uniref:hypothetical protein n=1 Tax=Vibrio aestuarianus TaxID=28171 RepID=UPI00237C64F5|nr:hypothetical protein [Vibrio aestuarianus]MDE1352116.1 hypothetical protein [Vibrio aestuarianus]
MIIDSEFFVKSAKKRAEVAIELAKWGWYPTPCAPVNVKLRHLTESNQVNEFHVERGKKYLSKNMEYCLEHAPMRSCVLKAGFRLHESGEFYGSVPIFLAQAEGVFNEVFKRSIFNNKHRSYENISKAQNLEEGSFFDAFLASTFVKNQIGADKSQCSEKLKVKGPNRNGIMHGDANHVDYGSEINSLKAFSLLCCAIWLSKFDSET